MVAIRSRYRPVSWRPAIQIIFDDICLESMAFNDQQDSFRFLQKFTLQWIFPYSLCSPLRSLWLLDGDVFPLHVMMPMIPVLRLQVPSGPHQNEDLKVLIRGRQRKQLKTMEWGECMLYFGLLGRFLEVVISKCCQPPCVAVMSVNVVNFVFSFVIQKPVIWSQRHGYRYQLWPNFQAQQIWEICRSSLKWNEKIDQIASTASKEIGQTHTRPPHRISRVYFHFVFKDKYGLYSI